MKLNFENEECILENLISRLPKELHLPKSVSFSVFDERDKKYKIMSVSKRLYNKMIIEGKENNLEVLIKKEDFI